MQPKKLSDKTLTSTHRQPRTTVVVVSSALLVGMLMACDGGKSNFTGDDDTLRDNSTNIKRSAIIPGTNEDGVITNPLIVTIDNPIPGGVECTGRIVGQHAVLTAAHCLCGQVIRDLKLIIEVEDEELNSYQTDTSKQISFKITDAVLEQNGQRIEIDANYDNKLHSFCTDRTSELHIKNDIALLRTYGPLRLAARKLNGGSNEPVSQSADELFGVIPNVDSEVFVYGRGTNDCNGNSDGMLRKSTNILRASNDLNFYLSSHPDNGTEGEGDSGSPIFDDQGLQVGVVSKGSHPSGQMTLGRGITDLFIDALREIEGFQCTPEQIDSCIENNSALTPQACFNYQGGARCAWLLDQGIDEEWTLYERCPDANWIPASKARELHWPIPISAYDAQTENNGYCLSNVGSTDFPDRCNNNGNCENGENNSNCPGDCPCNNNGNCDAGETHANCPSDCLCGNGNCDDGETSTNCPGDCYCGNASCDSGESCATCSADCDCNPFQVGQTWRGSYACNNNPGQLDLYVTSVSGDTVTAEFQFDIWGLTGSYLVSGTGEFNSTTQHVTLSRGDWVSNPGGVSRLSLTGDVSGTTFSGDVLYYSTSGDCGDFSLTLL